MKYKDKNVESEKPLYGEYRAKSAEALKNIARKKQKTSAELLALVPEESRGAVGAARVRRYVLDRLAPVAATLTPEHRKLRTASCLLRRGSRHRSKAMAEFQELLDFPPAPKLGIDGKLDARKASEAETRGQELFFGKAKCASCHTPPYYTDLTMHNLRAERFFNERMINDRKASADGPIKTFPLRGIKDSLPYLHDGRLLTLEDTVEFFI